MKERANEQSNSPCTAAGWPWPGAAFLTRCKCGRARAGLQEAGMGEGKTNQIHGKAVRGFPSTAGLGCITLLPQASLPFAKVLWGGGCSSTVELGLCNPPCPLQKKHHPPSASSPLPETPCSPCSEPSLPSPPRGWYHRRRSGAMCCHVLVRRAPRRRQPCSQSAQKPSSNQDPVWFCG